MHGFIGQPTRAKELFNTLPDKWLHFVDQTREESTWSRYDSALKHVLPVFGEKEIGDITRGDIRDFLTLKMNEGQSKSSIRLMRDVISGIFTFGIEDELVDSNPCEGIRKRRSLQAKSKRVEPEEVLNEGEIELFLTTCQEHFQKYYLFMLTACRTGMRKGELLGLRWSDIDFNSNTITVRQQYRRGGFKKPKGGRVSSIEISNQLREALLKAKKAKANKVVSMTGENDLVFDRGNGSPPSDEIVRAVFLRALKKAGLRTVKFHSLRHSCASILLSKGASIAFVSKQLRHSNPGITLGVYSHWVKTNGESEINLLDSGCSQVPKTCTQTL